MKRMISQMAIAGAMGLAASAGMASQPFGLSWSQTFDDWQHATPQFADANEDGKQNILRNSNDTAGDRAGSFTDWISLHDLDTPVLADFNGDGHTDLLGMNRYEDVGADPCDLPPQTESTRCATIR